VLWLFREAVEGYITTEKFFIGGWFVMMKIGRFKVRFNSEIDNSVEIDHVIQKLIL